MTDNNQEERISSNNNVSNKSKIYKTLVKLGSIIDILICFLSWIIFIILCIPPIGFVSIIVFYLVGFRASNGSKDLKRIISIIQKIIYFILFISPVIIIGNYILGDSHFTNEQNGYGILCLICWFPLVPFFVEKSKEKAIIKQQEQERQKYIEENTSSDSVCEYCGSNWLGKGCKHSPDGYHHHKKIEVKEKVVEKQVVKDVEKPKERIIGYACNDEHREVVNVYNERKIFQFSVNGKLIGYTSSNVTVKSGIQVKIYDANGRWIG